MKRLLNGGLGAIVGASIVALICYLHDGGGLAVPGAVAFLAGIGAAVGFLMGALGIKVTDEEESS